MTSNMKSNEFHTGISEIMDSYKDYIDDIDVKINTKKVKKKIKIK